MYKGHKFNPCVQRLNSNMHKHNLVQIDVTNYKKEEIQC